MYQFSIVSIDDFRTHVISASTDGKVMVWNLAKPKTRPIIYSGHTGGANSVDCHPNLDFVISGGEDRKIQLWPMKSKYEPKSVKIHRHNAPVTQV